MREIDFLDAVGRVNRRAVDECLTVTAEELKRERILRASRRIGCTAAAVLALFAGIRLFPRNGTEPPILPAESSETLSLEASGQDLSEARGGNGTVSGYDRSEPEQVEPEAEPERIPASEPEPESFPFAVFSSDPSLESYARLLASYFPHPVADPETELASDPQLCAFLLAAGSSIALEAGDVAEPYAPGAIRINVTAVSYAAKGLLGLDGPLPADLFSDPAWGYAPDPDTFPLSAPTPPAPSVSVMSIERPENGLARVTAAFPGGEAEYPVLVYTFTSADDFPPRPRLVSVTVP